MSFPRTLSLLSREIYQLARLVAFVADDRNTRHKRPQTAEPEPTQRATNRRDDSWSVEQSG